MKPKKITKPEPDTPTTLRERLQALINARNLTAHSASLAAGRSGGTLKAILAGKTLTPHRSTIAGIARGLNVSIDYLNGLTTEMDAPPQITDWSEKDEENKVIRDAVTAATGSGRGVIALIAGQGAEGLGIAPGARVIVDTTAPDTDGQIAAITSPETGRAFRYRVKPFWVAHPQTGPQHQLDTPETHVIGRAICVITQG